MTTLLLTATVTGYHAPLAPFRARRHGRAVACADAEPPEFLTLASLGLNADEQAALEVLLQKHDVREREREIDGIPQPWEADGDVSVDDPKSRLYQLFHDDFDGLFARRRQWEQAVAGRKLWLTAWQPTLIAAPLIAAFARLFLRGFLRLSLVARPPPTSSARSSPPARSCDTSNHSVARRPVRPPSPPARLTHSTLLSRGRASGRTPTSPSITITTMRSPFVR